MGELTKEELAVVADLRGWLRETPEAKDVAPILSCIDRLVSEVERLRARNEALEKVAKAVDEGACVECENCGGDGHLGRSFESGKLVACEKCGGHEDSLGDGFVLSDDLRAALSALAEPGKGGAT